MNKNNNMNDNNKMLERVLLMMKYDSSKTLTENSDVVKNEFSQILNEAPRIPRGTKVKATKPAPAPIKLPTGLTPAQAKLAGDYKSIYGKAPTKAQLATFQASGGKPPKGAGSSTINVGPGYTVTAKPPKPRGPKKPPTPKDQSILSRISNNIKNNKGRWSIGLIAGVGLTAAGIYLYLQPKVSPCLLDSLSEEELASLGDAGTTGTIARKEIGNRFADKNDGLTFGLDNTTVTTGNGQYKGSYSCDGNAIKVSIAGMDFVIGNAAGADKGTSGGGGGGGGSRYKQCAETFPIAMYCKNSTIARVQGCVGAKQDGAFGPNTSAALVAKGADGSSITQASVDKVCGAATAAKIEKLTSDVDVTDIGGNETTNNVKSSDNTSSEDGIGG